MGSYALLPGATVGEPIKADWAWKMKAGIDALRPMRRYGQRVTTTPYGTKIEYDDVAGETTELTTAYPFKVRWYAQDLDDPNVGEWQVYLPYGCVTLNGVSCLPVNDEGKDENGETTWQWYKIPDPSDSDANVSALNGYVAKEWTVYLHLKPWPRVKVCTTDDDEDFGLAMKRVAIATIGLVELDDYKEHVVVDVFKDEGIAETWSTSGAFALRYEIDLRSKDEKVKVLLTNATIALGRLSVELDEQDVTDWEAVWCKIKHDSEEYAVEVGKDFSEEKSDDDQTVFKLYELEDNVVKADARGSMPTLDFYTNSPD